MGIYGNAFDEYKYNLSLEECYSIIEEYNIALLEYYEDLEDSEDVVTEGANLEIRKIFKQYKKDVKDLKKKYRKDYRNDKQQAIKDLDEMNGMITKTIKEIKKVDADNVTSAILGDIYTIVIDTFLFIAGVKISALAGATIGSVSGSLDVGKAVAQAGGYATGVVFGNKIGNVISHFIANFKKFKDGKMTATEYFNAYRGEIIQTLEQSRRWNNGLKAGIRNEIKNQKEK